MTRRARVARDLPHYGPRPVALDTDSAAMRRAYVLARLSHACTACGAAAGRPCARACRLPCAWHDRMRLVLALDDMHADQVCSSE
jgi:hypothetical protein